MENVNKALLKVEDLHLSFGGLQALQDVSFEVGEGEFLAIIGPNGAGKTCVLNCINTFYRGQKGEVFFEGRRITMLKPHKVAQLGIGRTFQNSLLFTGLSTVDNLMAARHFRIKSNFLEQAIYWGRAHTQEVRHRGAVEDIVTFLELQQWRKYVVGLLPYGVRKRVDLGRALAQGPKLLLADEPMAGMNLEEKEDMARFLLDVREEMGITIVMIEHDMGVVMDIADRVIVLDFGRKLAEGTPEEIKVNPKVIGAYLGEEMTDLSQKA